MSVWLRMADSIEVASLPAGMDAYAGYVGGWWPDYAAIVAAHAGVPVLGIAISADEDAQALDVENGDATPAQAGEWAARQLARGIPAPVLYGSVSVVPSIVQSLHAAGVTRYLIWSAHYGLGEHICGPSTCGQLDVPADGTQWIDHGGWDESALEPYFFQSGVLAPPAPKRYPPAKRPARREKVDMFLARITGQAEVWLVTAGGRSPVADPADEATLLKLLGQPATVELDAKTIEPIPAA